MHLQANGFKGLEKLSRNRSLFSLTLSWKNSSWKNKFRFKRFKFKSKVQILILHKNK